MVEPLGTDAAAGFYRPDAILVNSTKACRNKVDTTATVPVPVFRSANGGAVFTYFYDFNFYVYFSMRMCSLWCFRVWQ